MAREKHDGGRVVAFAGHAVVFGALAVVGAAAASSSRRRTGRRPATPATPTASAQSALVTVAGDLAATCGAAGRRRAT